MNLFLFLEELPRIFTVEDFYELGKKKGIVRTQSYANLLIAILKERGTILEVEFDKYKVIS